MSIRPLPLAECEEILLRGRFGHLGVRDSDGVYVVPLSYVFSEGAIHAHAAPGHKVVLMRRWPHVAFAVDEVKDGANWRSVLVRGTFDELHSEADRTHSRLLLVRHFDGNPMSVTAGHGHKTNLADAVVFRIRIAELTGRAEGC